jgi:transcriptional regulator with XRE-family HTH domain
MSRRSDERWRERVRLAAALREQREARGLSRRDVADRSGLSYPYVSQLENGDREPSLDALGKLAAAFQVPVEELLKPPDVAESPSPERWMPNPAYAAKPRPQSRSSSMSSGSHRRRAELDVAISDAYEALLVLPPEDRIEAAGALLSRCLREIGQSPAVTRSSESDGRAAGGPAGR